MKKEEDRRNRTRWLPKAIELAITPKLYKRIKPKSFLNDIFAGTTVGIVALPLAMAFAIASGVSPEKGLFTAIIAGFLISVLSGSKFQIGGPTGAFVVIIYGVIQRHGYEGLIAATLLAGIFLVIFGLLRIGSYIKYIPYPVTTGFTSGIAVLILSTQIKDFFGLQIKNVPADFLDKWPVFFKNFLTLSPNVLIISLSTILIIFIIRKTYPKIPGQFVAVVLSALAVWYFGLNIDTIGSRFGGIPSALPSFHLPYIKFETFRMVLPDALTIAILAAIESLLCAVVADGMTGDKHYSNTELVGQGAANIASALFGGLPATGAIARTATSIKAGARTPLAGVIHAFVILLFVLFLSPLASYIPLASLAGILIVVAWDMGEARIFARMFRAPKSDLSVMLLTFTLTLIADLTVAVQFGMILAAVLFMKRMSDVTKMEKVEVAYESNEFDGDDPEAVDNIQAPKGVEIYEINGPFFFGVADKFSDEIGRVEATPKVIIIRMRYVPAIDATGIFALESFILRSRKVGTEIVLSGVKRTPKRILIKMGIAKLIGTKNITDHLDSSIARAKQLLEDQKQTLKS